MRILKQNKGAVLIIVLFIILLIVGVASALTIVAVTTYNSARNEIDKKQATFQAESTVKLIMNQLINEDKMSSGRLIDQLLESGPDGIYGSYEGTNGERGIFRIYYPDINDKTRIYITVTATVGKSASSVTTALRGEPVGADLISDYNIYITSPKDIYDYQFDGMRSSNPLDTLTFYLSADSIGNVLDYDGIFLESADGRASIVISGTLNMSGGEYWADVTAFGSLHLNDTIISENAYVRDSLSLNAASRVDKSVTAYGDISITGSGKMVYSVGSESGDILSGGQVTINDARIGSVSGVSVSSKANVLLNNSYLDGGVINQGTELRVLNGTSINGNIHIKGNLYIENSVINGNVRVDGNVIMRNSTISGTLNVKGNLDMETISSIGGNCVVDGRLTTAPLLSGRHYFGNNLSIGMPTGVWDRGEEAVKLLSVQVVGTVITSHKVVFSQTAITSGRSSIIGTLYIRDDYKRWGTPTDGAGEYIDLQGSTIHNLRAVSTAGIPKDLYIVNGEVNNIYGDNLNIKSIIQQAGGKYDGKHIYFVNSESYLSGEVYSSGEIIIESGANIYNTARIYAYNGLSVASDTESVRQGEFHAGGALNILGAVGSLYIASGANIVSLGANVNGDLVSAISAGLTISHNVLGSVQSQGNITIGANIGGNVRTPLTVTVNGGTIGSTISNQLYAGQGIVDNGGATINSSIYNQSTSVLNIQSVVHGNIFTLGNININTNALPIGGYVRAQGASTSVINRSVNGNIHLNGNLDITSASRQLIGGNIRALNVRLNNVEVNGNIHVTGAGFWSNRSIQLDGCDIRGSLYSSHSSAIVRLGIGTGVGIDLESTDTVIYCMGQLILSAGNTIYGRVYAGRFYTGGPTEGSSNLVMGDMLINGNVEIYHNHNNVYSEQNNSYQGIYAGGSVIINSMLRTTGQILYVRGVGTINISNYTVTGMIYGPADITLSNVPNGGVQASDPGNMPMNFVKLNGTSPTGGSVWSSNGFDQSDASPISGSLRVDGSSEQNYVFVKANVGGIIYISNTSLRLSPSVNVGNSIYARYDIILVGNNTIEGYVYTQSGSITIGSGVSMYGSGNGTLTHEPQNIPYTAPVVYFTTVSEIPTPNILPALTQTLTIPLENNYYASPNVTAALSAIANVSLMNLVQTEPAEAYQWTDPRTLTGGSALNNTVSYTLTQDYDYIYYLISGSGTLPSSIEGTTGQSVIIEFDTRISGSDTEYKDLHILMAPSQAISWQDNSNSRISIIGGGRVIFYLMGNNTIDLRGNLVYQNDELIEYCYVGIEEIEYSPKMYFVGIGGSNTLYFDNIMVRAGIYMPHGNHSSDSPGKNSVVMNTTNNLHYINGIIVADEIRLLTSGDGEYLLIRSGLPSEIEFNGTMRPLNYFLYDPLLEYAYATYSWKYEAIIYN